MKYLVYVSSATAHFSEEDLKILLVNCRENNNKSGITGMLLCADDNFIQVIEGERAVIDGLYAKISNDKRHKSFQILLQGEIESRSFPDWSMGFKQISKEDFSEIIGFENLQGSNLDCANSIRQKSVLHLLKNFLKINSPQARYF